MEEPDKGYAWIIVIAAFTINMILSGMARMIGFLYVDIIEVYGVTREEASLPFIVRNAIRYLSGPLVSMMGKSYGIRTVSLYGGLLAAAGSVLTCFSPNVSWIVFFWGGIHGLGFAMASTLYPVLVNEYFERHRATASGIVLSGACIGCLVFPLLLETILDTYGAFGCFLILGGLFLNVIPAALLLKSPPWVDNTEEYARKRERANKSPTFVENCGQQHPKSPFKNT
ncbi:Monocarboxylate transporter 9, partial [Stegodyphus mimosarum]